ncbi:hypothetical protein Hanom_Chr02g00112131 [Helianthus anomalus]
MISIHCCSLWLSYELCNYVPSFVYRRAYEICTLYILCDQIWITDGLLEYHRATSRTTRSYPSPLGNNAYTPIQEETQ